LTFEGHFCPKTNVRIKLSILRFLTEEWTGTLWTAS
jgi:hypothetical protein